MTDNELFSMEYLLGEGTTTTTTTITMNTSIRYTLSCPYLFILFCETMKQRKRMHHVHNVCTGRTHT